MLQNFFFTKASTENNLIQCIHRSCSVLLKREKMDANVSSISIKNKFFLLRNLNVYIIKCLQFLGLLLNCLPLLRFPLHLSVRS